MNKTSKIVLGSVAALGLLGGGTAIAIANNNQDATPTSTSSVSVVTPGTTDQTQPQAGQVPGGQPPAGQAPGGMPGGPMVDALVQALGLDATTVSTAIQEVETELGVFGPEASQSTEFQQALAEKLGVSVDEVTAVASSMPQPGQGGMGQPPAGGMGQPPAGGAGSAPQIQVPSGAATPSTES